ncbi:hypothetical protein GOBAR_AA10907 [Gossypium barbadense]|uniref:Subtilisin-like protease fibronectin type-III domain-containing protein n=1 Tax=Gossypium barbadense TaxID=3634 RepID=A0A2P5Y2C9_GOSBA|nr:hypothetical protein GOBAR_AA10907 [Gossypium barbadense]
MKIRDSCGELSSGSDQINPTKAVNPGLIYDINEDLYISFLCKQGYDTRTITLLIGGKKEYHCSSFKPGRGIDGLNYPSMHIYLNGTNPNISAVFHRIETNVEEGDLEYNVKVASPKELSVVVIPKTLKFNGINQKKTFRVLVKGGESMMNGTEAVSATLEWNSNKGHSVKSPIVVFKQH